MSFDPVDAIVRELRRWYLPRRRIERAAELLVEDGPRCKAYGCGRCNAAGLWERRVSGGRVYVPATSSAWIRWDAAPGQALRLNA